MRFRIDARIKVEKQLQQWWINDCGLPSELCGPVRPNDAGNILGFSDQNSERSEEGCCSPSIFWRGGCTEMYKSSKGKDTEKTLQLEFIRAGASKAAFDLVFPSHLSVKRLLVFVLM